MSIPPDLAPPPSSQPWTKPDDYFGTLARRRTARKSRAAKPRTQPEAPRLLLSTLPFLALIAALAVLTAAIVVAAWPGSEPRRTAKAAQPEVGTADKGWFQEAQKQFH